eukprot:gene13187-9545_t
MARRRRKKFGLGESYKGEKFQPIVKPNMFYNIELEVNENGDVIQTNPENNIKFPKMRLEDI